MAEPINRADGPKQLTPKEKLIATLLSLTAVLIFSFWYINFQTTLMYMPLGGVDPKTLKDDSLKNNIPVTDENKDTDKDGLTDLKEANLYKTSAYLPDTDGDGISDYDEVHSGTDPLCPQNKDCSRGGLYSSADDVSATSTPTLLTPSLSKAQIDTMKQALDKNIDPKVLRQSLAANLSEADKATLDKFTDAQILQAYSNMVNKVQTGATVAQ